jgi:hypothetical protein
MVRKMEIEFDEEINAEEFIFPAIKIAEKQDKHITLNITGDINPLLHKISQYKIKNMVFPEPSLEDMFMTYYRR